LPTAEILNKLLFKKEHEDYRIQNRSWGLRKKSPSETKGFDGTFPAKMKQITGARWSPGQRCCHIPYTPETWEQFKGVFPNYEVDPGGCAAGWFGASCSQGGNAANRAAAPRPESRPLNPDPAHAAFSEQAFSV
jgi:hypothetical protein